MALIRGNPALKKYGIGAPLQHVGTVVGLQEKDIGMNGAGGHLAVHHPCIGDEAEAAPLKLKGVAHGMKGVMTCFKRIEAQGAQTQSFSGNHRNLPRQGGLEKGRQIEVMVTDHGYAQLPGKNFHPLEMIRVGMGQENVPDESGIKPACMNPPDQLPGGKTVVDDEGKILSLEDIGVGRGPASQNGISDHPLTLQPAVPGFRSVTHRHILAVPDYGCPHKTRIFKKLFPEIKTHIGHPSLLVGRTGGVQKFITVHPEKNVIQLSRTQGALIQIHQMKIHSPFLEKPGGLLGVLALFSADYLYIHGALVYPDRSRMARGGKRS
jgi:hypothetical protein